MLMTSTEGALLSHVNQTFHPKVQNSNLTPEYIRSECENEQIVTIDMSYIQEELEIWWRGHKGIANIQFQKILLESFFLDKIKAEHLAIFERLGLRGSYVAGVNLVNLFKTECARFSLAVHEALSDLFHINDVKYPYEHHKTLCLRPGGQETREWGSGAGEISPHSDDLYEDIDTDYLSLTVCKDNTNTATQCLFPREIIRTLSDSEIEQLLGMDLIFVSGKNVVGKTIRRERSAIENCNTFGVRFFLDFRMDEKSGARMMAASHINSALLDKIRRNLSSYRLEKAQCRTGTFLVVANHKVLHARAPINLDPTIVLESSKASDWERKERLLYRSKGSRRHSDFGQFCDLN